MAKKSSYYVIEKKYVYYLVRILFETRENPILRPQIKRWKLLIRFVFHLVTTSKGQASSPLYKQSQSLKPYPVLSASWRKNVPLSFLIEVLWTFETIQGGWIFLPAEAWKVGTNNGKWLLNIFNYNIKKMFGMALLIYKYVLEFKTFPHCVIKSDNLLSVCIAVKQWLSNLII